MVGLDLERALPSFTLAASASFWASAVACLAVGSDWAPGLALLGGTAPVMAWVFPVVGPWYRLLPVTAVGLVAFGVAGLAAGHGRAWWFVAAGLAAVPASRALRRLRTWIDRMAERGRARTVAAPPPRAVPGRGQRPLSIRSRTWLDLAYPAAHVPWAVASTAACGWFLVERAWAMTLAFGLFGFGLWAGVCYVFAPLRTGLRWTPRCRWHLAVAGDELRIFTRRHETRVDLTRVRAAAHVVDGGWDGLAGLEEECFLLQLGEGLPLIVPGSSTGFEQLRPALEKRGLRIAEREFD